MFISQYELFTKWTHYNHVAGSNNNTLKMKNVALTNM